MNNTKFERQKKLLLVLPFLVLPFAVMFFWALGGGTAAQAQEASGITKGLNVQLPGAHLKNDSSENKLSFYEQAEKDSLKFQQARKDDPNYKGDTTGNTSKRDSLNRHDTGIVPRSYGNNIGSSFSGRSLSNSRAALATDESEIDQKLALLNKQINQPPAPVANNLNTGSNSDSELNQLRASIQKMSNNPDPQMEQLSTMLDKIQEIQNPGLAQQKMKAESEKNRGQVFAVSSGKRDDPVSTLDNGLQTGPLSNQQHGFYSLDNSVGDVDPQNAIVAVIHKSQTIVSGSVVTLRLVNDIYINGVLIPKDNLLSNDSSL